MRRRLLLAGFGNTLWASQYFTGLHVWDSRSRPRRMLKKADQLGRSERRAEAYPLGYVESLSDARTPLADFFSILLGVLVVILVGFADREMDAAAVAPSAEMKTQVFRYLVSRDTDEAARTLQAMLSDPDVTIDQAIRIIQTERDYAPQPTGIIPDDRVQRYSLFLNEQLINSSKPLVVLTNGQLSFEGPVTPSLETLLRQARLRQYSRRLFPIHLAIQVRKQP